MTTLRLTGISRSCGDNGVLRDTELTIRDEEFVVVVGPSGYGKTTLLQLIAGLEVPDSGRITGRVLHFERLGTDTHVIVDLGQEKLMTFRPVGQHEFELGGAVAVDFDDNNAVSFDEQGQRMANLAQPDSITPQPATSAHA